MMVSKGRGNSNESRAPSVAGACLCPNCGTSIPLPADSGDLRLTQIAAGLTCNFGFFAMLAARTWYGFTLDAVWAAVYIFGVGGYALVLSKALNVKLKHFEMQLPMGGKIEGGMETTSTETTVHQITHKQPTPPQ